MPGTLVFLTGSEGVGKTTIARALQDKYNTPEKKIVFLMTRDDAREEIDPGRTKPLTEDIKREIYVRLLKYAKTILEETSLENKEIIVVLEGNWLKDERLKWPQLQRCLRPQQHGLHFKTLVAFCACGNSAIQFRRVSDRALQKDKDHGLLDYGTFLEHYAKRRRQDEEAVAKLGRNFPLKRIETKSYTLDNIPREGWATHMSELLEDIMRACKDLHRGVRWSGLGFPQMQITSRNSSMASLSTYALERGAGDTVISPNLAEFVAAMTSTRTYQIPQSFSMDSLTAHCSINDDETDSKRAKIVQTPIITPVPST